MGSHLSPEFGQTIKDETDARRVLQAAVIATIGSLKEEASRASVS